MEWKADHLDDEVCVQVWEMQDNIGIWLVNSSHRKQSAHCDGTEKWPLLHCSGIVHTQATQYIDTHTEGMGNRKSCSVVHIASDRLWHSYYVWPRCTYIEQKELLLLTEFLDYLPWRLPWFICWTKQVGIMNIFGDFFSEDWTQDSLVSTKNIPKIFMVPTCIKTKPRHSNITSVAGEIISTDIQWQLLKVWIWDSSA